MRKINLLHQTHRETAVKFLFLVLILLGYFGYLSWQYDIATGGMIAAITWSFFVLCTPVADAGFILDFPIRLLFGLRMIITELFVWILALSINIATLFFNPDIYQMSLLTKVFYKILTTPYPYWLVIVLCGVGTFLSIYFGDEMLDVITHKDREKHHTHAFKYKIIMMVAIFTVIFIAYHHLVEDMGLSNLL